MESKFAFVICLLTILSEIVSSQRTDNGYVYQQPNGQQFSHQNQLLQQQPSPQQAIYTQDTNYIQKGQHNLPYNQNGVNFATHHQPSLNLELPTAPQVNNINYSPPQQLNPQATQNDVIRLQFEIQGNSIEPDCNSEPIIGQFKPELVDLANGGPLTRVIETCGPGTDCKTIALQSDLNRVQAVLPKFPQNQNGPHSQDGFNRGIEGRGNAAGAFIHSADVTNSLIRPPNRRLIEYTEILQDDIYN